MAKENTLAVTVPTRRPDLRDEWDLIEEVGRMYGYDKVAPIAPFLPLLPSRPDTRKRFVRASKEYLAAVGFDEVITYSFYSEKDRVAARLPEAGHLMLENPMNPDQALLRATLLPTLLRKVRENLRHMESFSCFEWESVFAKGVKKGAIREQKMLALSMTVPKGMAKETFFILKGQLVAFLDSSRVAEVAFVPLSEDISMPITTMLHPTRSAAILSHGRVIGVMGELHPAVAKNFGLDARVACAELDAEALHESVNGTIAYEPLRRFPYATRDISLTFPSASPRQATVGAIEDLFREAGAPLLEKWELFDIYEWEEGKRLAFHLFFGAADRTITSDEMDAVFDRIVAEAEKRFEAQLKQ